MLVSEVMLQQTQAGRVDRHFAAFLSRFPDPATLAAASRADVIRAWGDLGYHRRAVGLHAAARVIVSEHGGRVPSEQRDLRSLPGVGSYTAAAVASIAFGARVVALDTNVRRIVARVAGGAEPDEVADAWLAIAAEGMLTGRDPGGWNEALMDLGREHCRPVPRCEGCPLRPWCRFDRLGRLGRSSSSRQGSFEGSNRQARGRVVAVLRQRTAAATLAQLVRLAGIAPDRVAAAVEGLVRDGVVERTPSGRIRLPR